MRVLIIEDEKVAADRLENLLLEINPQYQVAAKLGTGGLGGLGMVVMDDKDFLSLCIYIYIYIDIISMTYYVVLCYIMLCYSILYYIQYLCYNYTSPSNSVLIVSTGSLRCLWLHLTIR